MNKKQELRTYCITKSDRIFRATLLNILNENNIYDIINYLEPNESYMDDILALLIKLSDSQLLKLFIDKGLITSTTVIDKCDIIFYSVLRRCSVEFLNILIDLGCSLKTPMNKYITDDKPNYIFNKELEKAILDAVTIEKSKIEKNRFN
jgi:hypothetical protein